MSEQALSVRIPVQARGSHTVGAIRAAARELLRQRDFARVTVADLAKAAEVGVGTFYHYFPTKEALLLDLRGALLEETLASLAESLAAPVSSRRELIGRLEKLLRTWISHSVEQRGLERAIGAASYESEAFARKLRSQEAGIARLVAEYLRAHRARLRALDPDAAADALVTLVVATVARAMREPELARAPDALVAEVARMLGHYLVPDRQGAAT